MEIITIVIGGVAGFLVGQANGYFERRSARKIALSKALSELLEIRHRFKGSMYIFKRLMNETTLSSDDYKEIISGLPESLLWDKQISTRYNEAVNLLSAHVPILAFLLRSKDIAGFLGSGTLINFVDSQESLAYMQSTLVTAEQAMSPKIEQSIELVAGLIGKKQKAWVSQYIAETQEPPPEARNILDSLLNAVQHTASQC